MWLGIAGGVFDAWLVCNALVCVSWQVLQLLCVGTWIFGFGPGD